MLTKHRFLWPARRCGEGSVELWMSGTPGAPKGRNPGQAALGTSKAGAHVLRAALLGGSISERKGEVEGQSPCRTEGKHGLPNSQ